MAGESWSAALSATRAPGVDLCTCLMQSLSLLAKGNKKLQPCAFVRGSVLTAAAAAGTAFCLHSSCHFLQDVGMVALGFRLLEKMVDLNALFTLAAPIMHKMPDFQQQVGDVTTDQAA